MCNICEQKYKLTHNLYVCVSFLTQSLGDYLPQKWMCNNQNLPHVQVRAFSACIPTLIILLISRFILSVF